MSKQMVERTVCDFEGCNNQGARKCDLCGMDICDHHTMNVISLYVIGKGNKYICVKCYRSIFQSEKPGPQTVTG